MTTGEHIKELRNERGMLQSELGQKVGCTAQRISNIERGVTQLPADLAARIAAALNVSVDELTSSDNPELYRLSKEEQVLIRMFRGLKEKDRLMLIRMFNMFMQNKNEP